MLKKNTTERPSRILIPHLKRSTFSCCVVLLQLNEVRSKSSRSDTMTRKHEAIQRPDEGWG